MTDEIPTLFDNQPAPMKPWQGGPRPIEKHIDGLPAPIRFDGDTYEPTIDAERLGSQAKAVFTLMQDRVWRTLAEIAMATGYPEASISARLRDFRKKKFGASEVDRRRRSVSQWEYRLTVTREDLRG